MITSGPHVPPVACFQESDHLLCLQRHNPSIACRPVQLAVWSPAHGCVTPRPSKIRAMAADRIGQSCALGSRAFPTLPAVATQPRCARYPKVRIAGASRPNRGLSPIRRWSMQNAVRIGHDEQPVQPPGPNSRISPKPVTSFVLPVSRSFQTKPPSAEPRKHLTRPAIVETGGIPRNSLGNSTLFDTFDTSRKLSPR